MRTTKRRRLDAALLGAGALACAGITVIGGVVADTERITGMWVGASLAPDGSAAVTEVIDYDFGFAQDKHGIFRTIPGLGTEDRVDVASASAPDGIDAKNPTLINGEPGIEIRIGDPNTTITGRHRYQISYDHPSLMEGPDLAWDAVGTEWTVEIQQAEVHVVAPWSFEDLVCSIGQAGDTGGCELTQPEPGHLVATTGAVKSGEGITIGATRGQDLASAPTLPAPPLEAAPDPGAGLALPAGVAAVATAGAAGVTSRLVRRRGRERVSTGGVADAAWAGDGGPAGEVLVDHEDLAAMATTEFAPPQGISPSMGGVILTEEVRPEHKVAWLIESAISGAVELEELDGRAVRLIRRPSGDAQRQRSLDRMFSGRSELMLGRYDPAFAAGWSEVGAELEDWQRNSGLWDRQGDQRKIVVRFIGGLTAVLGAVALAATGAAASRWGTEWLPAVAVAGLVTGAGIAALVRGWELRVRTPEGSGLWLRVESFRRFLASSEAYHAEEAAKLGVLREYTAWAVAVGEIDRWERAVSSSGAIPDQAGLGYVHMAPLLFASTSSASTAPSSSGSGGGGGSVGGGGGGGGGGSW
ncbi:MAG: DUF2207 domain-containing protein [Acidimicrobiales bacterium]